MFKKIILMLMLTTVWASPRTIIEGIINHQENLQKVLDIDSIAADVAGRKYWLSASKAERAAFTKKLKQEILNNYRDIVQSLSKYRLDFISSASARRQVLRVYNPNGSTSNLVVFFRKQGNKWLVIDSSFNGISLVAQWRAKFAGNAGE